MCQWLQLELEGRGDAAQLVQETPAQLEPQPVLGAGVGGHPCSSYLPQGHKAPQQPWLHGEHPQRGDATLSRATDTRSAVIVHL